MGLLKTREPEKLSFYVIDYRQYFALLQYFFIKLLCAFAVKQAKYTLRFLLEYIYNIGA